MSLEVEKKLAFAFEPMGEQKVKNIAEPISVFKSKVDGMSARKVPSRARSFMSPGVVAGSALATFLILIAVGGALWFWPWASSIPAAVTQASVVDAKPTLVVLPFDSLSDDKEQAYVAHGITEDLTTELARIPNLFVISRNAAFTYKGKPIQPAQVGKELGVRYILEGSIRRAGDDLRINAQLIDATTGGHMWAERFDGGWSNVFELLWAERFDGEWSDVFELQDKIVEQIATALKLRLVAAQIAGGTSNPAAYEAYLRGRELKRSAKPDDWAKAVRHLQQALALDPKFGSAAAELAWIYQNAMWVESTARTLGVSPDEARSKSAAYLHEAAKHPSPIYYQLLSDQLSFQ